MPGVRPVTVVVVDVGDVMVTAGPDTCVHRYAGVAACGLPGVPVRVRGWVTQMV